MWFGEKDGKMNVCVYKEVEDIKDCTGWFVSRMGRVSERRDV